MWETRETNRGEFKLREDFQPPQVIFLGEITFLRFFPPGEFP